MSKFTSMIQVLKVDEPGQGACITSPTFDFDSVDEELCKMGDRLLALRKVAHAAGVLTAPPEGCQLVAACLELSRVRRLLAVAAMRGLCRHCGNSYGENYTGFCGCCGGVA